MWNGECGMRTNTCRYDTGCRYIKGGLPCANPWHIRQNIRLAARPSFDSAFRTPQSWGAILRLTLLHVIWDHSHAIVAMDGMQCGVC